jgi:hypothetical protein
MHELMGMVIVPTPVAQLVLEYPVPITAVGHVSEIAPHVQLQLALPGFRFWCAVSAEPGYGVGQAGAPPVYCA